MIPREHKEWFWKAVEALAKSPIAAGDFEIRFCECNNQIEMVRNQPNPLYGTEKDYFYSESCRGYYHKHDDDVYSQFCISESCFKSKNNCYTVMALDESNDPCEYSWRTVGNRPFSINDSDSLHMRACIDKLNHLMRRI